MWIDAKLQSADHRSDPPALNQPATGTGLPLAAGTPHDAVVVARTEHETLVRAKLDGADPRWPGVGGRMARFCAMRTACTCQKCGAPGRRCCGPQASERQGLEQNSQRATARMMDRLHRTRTDAPRAPSPVPTAPPCPDSWPLCRHACSFSRTAFRRVFGPAAARHQAGSPFPDGPHGVRETVPNRGAMARDFTAERRHHTPSARRSRWSADRYREVYSSRVVASFMRAALVFRAWETAPAASRSLEPNWL
jgi:hypothetical protein